MASTTITDPKEIESLLRKWCSEATIKNVEFDKATMTLSSGGVSIIDAKVVLTIKTNNNKQCSYSVGAIFLQIQNPKQGLVPYRNACKEFTISDPLKSLDKPIVVEYFLPSTDPVAAAATTTTSDTKAPSASSKEKEPKKSSSSKHHHDKHHRSSSSSKHHHSSSSKRKHSSSSHHRSSTSSSSKRPKAPQMVTTEQLFQNLAGVVGRRPTETATIEKTNAAAEITAALSAKGFETAVAQALEEKNKERTAAILANEIPVGNSASILRANNPNKDLSRVLELYNERMNASGSRAATASSSSSKHGSSGPSSSSSSKNKKPAKQHLLGKNPIILVPKGMTAPVTMINAHEFLCNGKFVPRDTILRQGGQRRPGNKFTRSVKTVDGGTASLEYEIMDNPKKLGTSPLEWDRIVAVVVLGQGWQFKDWMRTYNTPASLFDKVFGYYISMESDKSPADVRQWAVTHGKVNRDKRGLDSITYTSFWNGLDEWMKVYKRELLPSSS